MSNTRNPSGKSTEHGWFSSILGACQTLKKVLWDKPSYQKIAWQGAIVGSQHATLNHFFFDRIMNTLQTEKKMVPLDVIKHAYKDLYTRNYQQVGFAYTISIVQAITKTTSLLFANNIAKNILDEINLTSESFNRKASSIAAGIVATAGTHWLSTWKQRSLAGQSFAMVKKLNMKENCAGLPLTFARNVMTSFIFFEAKHYIESYFASHSENLPKSILENMDLTVATIAGTIAAAVTTPIANTITFQKLTGLNSKEALQLMLQKNGKRALYQSGFFATTRMVTEAYILTKTMGPSHKNEL